MRNTSIKPEIKLCWPAVPPSEKIYSYLNKVCWPHYSFPVLTEGVYVKEFEQRISKFLSTPNLLALNSGTAGLELALITCGVEAGDEVITSPLTFPATNHAILLRQARVVFSDIQYETGNLDPNEIEQHITPKTKAIMLVHWGGYPADLDEINAIAKSHGLFVIADGAHALGAKYKGKPIGTATDYTMFSLQAIKQMTTIDGGLLAINDQSKYESAKRRRWFGIDRDETCLDKSEGGYSAFPAYEEGGKFAMNNITACWGLAALEDHFLSKNLYRRKQVSEHYDLELKGLEGIRPFEKANDREGGCWLYNLHVCKRRAFIHAMASKGIETSIVNQRNDILPIFGGVKLSLSQLNRLNEDRICIPLHPFLSDEDVSYIIDSIRVISNVL